MTAPKAKSNRPGTKNKSNHGSDRREEILAAAVRRFSKDGYQKASIAAIANDVGLSQPGLLHYFPTKVDFLLAILERRDLESAPILRGTLEWRALLQALVDAVQRNTQNPDVVKAFAILNAESLTVEHPAQAWFLERALNLRANIAASLQRGVETKELRADLDCHSIAAELIGFMDGLQMFWLRAPDHIDMGEAFSAYIERLIQSITAREK
ncbi:TetR family transcriptional regulator [Burkholderia cepacia]|nr:TetR family transcriptional regulator [Burkholderia cepacia]